VRRVDAASSKFAVDGGRVTVHLGAISAGEERDLLLEVAGPLPAGLGYRLTVRARPGRLSGLSVFHIKSVLYDAFVWARTALNIQKRRFPARAVHQLRWRLHRRRCSEGAAGPPARNPQGWPNLCKSA
jgi:hypothetical protein